MKLKTLIKTTEKLARPQRPEENAKNRIDMKKQSIERQEGEAVDINKEEQRINVKINRITAKKCRLLQEQMEHTEKCLKASMLKVRDCPNSCVRQYTFYL